VALARTPGSFPPTTARLRAAGGPRAALLAAEGLFADEAEQRGAREIARWREQGLRALSYEDPAYPHRLGQLDDPPPLLFLRGELTRADNDGVAVIGTRRPSLAGAGLAAEVASALAESGHSVLSGLAAGIDTAAHQAALAAGGRSIAVIGNGLHHVYPPVNATLQQRLQGVISQFWPEQPPSRQTFPLRNAVMSGISRATVIIEAGVRSGARIQARHALAQGRELFLMAPLLREEWARALAASAGVRVLDAPGELLEALG
jgi:DNA processing protein